MFRGFTSYFQRIQINPLPLRFEMDLDEQGRHVVSILRVTDQHRYQKVEISRLLEYGYREEAELDNRKIIYQVSKQDRQTLSSLKSLNPVIEQESLIFEIEPPVLQYLRRKRNLAEAPQSQLLQVSDQPIRPIARIDFKPGEGLRVQTGFEIAEKGALASPESLRRTPSGKYARIGNVFSQVPLLSNEANEWLKHPIRVIPPSQIPEFILRDLVLLKSEFKAVLTDLAQQIRVIQKPIQTTVQVNKGPGGWLDFKITYNITGENVSIAHELISKKADEKFFQLDRETWVEIDSKAFDHTQKELLRLGAEKTEDGFRVPATEFASLEDFIAEIGGHAELSHAYQEFIGQLAGFEADLNFRLPEEFEKQLVAADRSLRSYQRAGIHWLNWLRESHLHGILADDMGLGKTLESLCAMRLGYETTRSQQHSLIIAPKSVLYHWEREIHNCYPSAQTRIYHGSGREKSVFSSSVPFVVITTYDTVSRDIDDLSKVPFYYLILDEATKIKNPDARRTQAIKALNATHRLALSGIPVENRPGELWSLFDFLMKGHLGQHGTFVRIFEGGIIAGNQLASQQLGRRIKPFVLRRKKEDVAKDLPEKLPMTEWCSLTEEQRELYGGLQDKLKELRSALQQGKQVNYTTSILPLLTKLKQICDHPALVTTRTRPLYGRSEKFDWIVDKVCEIMARNEQVVIFSHFLDMLNLLELAVKEKGLSYMRIDGSTGNRQQLIDAFNQGRAKIALLSIMAAGYGINLTAANHVIHADRWWNPAVEDQATDRVHRIGQTRNVYVYYILVEGTLEERINDLLQSKRGMADQILNAVVEGPRKWTREELIEILRPLD